MITHFDDRYAVAKFSKSRVWSKVPDGCNLLFEGDLNFLITQCRIGRRKLPYPNQPDSFIRFDRTQTCDRQTQTRGPFLYLLQNSLHGFPRLFTVISEHICFLILVLLFLHFSVVGFVR